MTTGQYEIHAMDGKPIEEYGFAPFSTDDWFRRSVAIAALAEYFVGVLKRGAYSRAELKGGVAVNFVLRDAEGNPEFYERCVTVRSGRHLVKPGIDPVRFFVNRDVQKGVSNYQRNWANLPNLLQPEVVFSVEENSKGFVIHQRSAATERRTAVIWVPFNSTNHEADRRRAGELPKWLNFMASKVTPTQRDVEREVNEVFRVWTHYGALGEVYESFRRADGTSRDESGQEEEEGPTP